MNLPSGKRSAIAGAAIYAAFGVAAGLLLIFLSAELLLSVAFLVMGIVTIVSNLPGLLRGIATVHTKAGVLTLVLSAVAVALGVLMLLLQEALLFWVVGIYMILIPAVDVLISKERWAQLKAELPKLIIGAVLLIVGPAASLGVLFDVAGVAVIVLSALYVVMVAVSTRKYQHQTGARVFVDSDGNGKIDTVYVDTTGDGQADTATRYKEEQ